MNDRAGMVGEANATFPPVKLTLLIPALILRHGLGTAYGKNADQHS